MPISKADLAEVLSHEGRVAGDASLAVLQTAEEVIGFAIAEARAEQWDMSEPDLAELIVRGADLKPDRVRSISRTFRRLGYIPVADRLRHIAGRRKHELTPLSSQDRQIPLTNVPSAVTD